MMRQIRIVLISDFCMFRSGLRLLIESQPGRVVVGEAVNIDEAVEIVRAQLPHLVILEARKATGESIRGISRLHCAGQPVKVLVISSPMDARLRHLAVQSGAVGIVSKDSVPEVLLNAVDKIDKGEAWIDRSTVADVLTEVLGLAKPQGDEFERDKVGSLTQRERDVVNKVARGLSNKQIGAALSISEVTVRHHLTSIFSKLEVADRYELTLYALKNSICDNF